jgi:hypothetical protein
MPRTPLTADELWIVAALRERTEADGERWGRPRLADAVGRSEATLARYLVGSGILATDGMAVLVRGERVGVASEAARARVESLLNPRRLQTAKSASSAPPPPPHELSQTWRADDAQEVSSRSTRIRSLDELLAAFDIDRAVWEVDRPTVNSWEGLYTVTGSDGERRAETVTLYQIKASLRRRVSRTVEEGFRLLAERLQGGAPATPVAGASDDGHLLEFSLVDHHFGKLAWRGETGEDYDLRIAERLYRGSADLTIQRFRHWPIGRILMPIGHDLLNWDSARGETAGGTPQDNDSRPAKVLASALASIVYAVERLAEVAPVDVVYVSGNHDPTTGFAVALAVQAWFRADARVTVDLGVRPRKVFTFGKCFIGLTHGDMAASQKRQLSAIFATEFAEEWGPRPHREIHTGHLHHRGETHYLPLSDCGGTPVRILPSLCGRDAWHARSGYIGGPRATDAYLWHPQRGLAGTVITYADEVLAA